MAQGKAAILGWPVMLDLPADEATGFIPPQSREVFEERAKENNYFLHYFAQPCIFASSRWLSEFFYASTPGRKDP